ncbi:MAG: phospholipid carrier-dependent glycosyltransferase [Rudaea sp.]
MAIPDARIGIRDVPWRRTLFSLPVLLALALILRVIFLLLAGVRAPLAGDESQYQQIAENLAAGRGFIQNNNPFFPGQILYAWQAPLYPLLLGILYRLLSPDPLVGKLFGILLGVVTVAVVYDLARRIWRPRGQTAGESVGAAGSSGENVALLGGFAVAAYPGFLTNAHLLLSETLFAFLLVAAFDLVIAAEQAAERQARGGRPAMLWIAAGGTWGAAALTRGIALYFALPLVLWGVWLAWRDRRRLGSALGSAALFVVAVAAVMLPWTVRNYATFHQFVLLETKGGVNFWLGNSPDTPADLIRNVWKVGVREPMLSVLPTDEVGRDRAGYSLGLDFVREKPLIFIERMPVKFADFWGFERNLVDVAQATRDGKAGGWSSISKAAADLLSDGAYVVLMLLAIGGFVFAPNDRYKLLFAGFVAYFVGLHLVVFGDGRFHFPLVPVLGMYAAWFAVSGVPARARRGLRPGAALVLALVFVLVWAHEVAAAAAVFR